MATFTPPEYITQAELEARHGVSAVAQLFDRAGGGVGDTAAVTFAIQEASGFVDAFLDGKFPHATIDLLKQDYRFKGCVCDIAMRIGSEKPEFTDNNGNTPWTVKGKRAETTLDLIGKGIQRLGAESAHGRNPTLAGATSVTLPHKHVFATSRTNTKGYGSF